MRTSDALNLINDFALSGTHFACFTDKLGCTSPGLNSIHLPEGVWHLGEELETLGRCSACSPLEASLGNSEYLRRRNNAT